MSPNIQFLTQVHHMLYMLYNFWFFERNGCLLSSCHVLPNMPSIGDKSEKDTFSVLELDSDGCTTL